MDTWTTYPEFEVAVPSDLGTGAEVPAGTGPTGPQPPVWGVTFLGTGPTGPQPPVWGVTFLGTGPTGPQSSVWGGTFSGTGGGTILGTEGVTFLGTGPTGPQPSVWGVTFSGVGPTATFKTLVEAVRASQDPLAEVRERIDADNADERIRFMDKVPCLTSAQLAEQLGYGAEDKSQTASLWKAERMAFSVPWRGHEQYPAFQFRDVRPLPVIATVLKALPNNMTPWQIAFWFVSSNPWLDGKAPYKMLSDTDSIVQAARQEDEAIVG
jgi:hypothetical protein